MRILKSMSDAEKLEVLLFKTQLVGECYEWTGCLNSDGYPKIFWQGNANGKGHRIVFKLSHPEDNMDGIVIRHTCDNPKCINPDHLVPGSPKDNMADRDARERHGAAKLSHAEVLEIDALLRNQTNCTVTEVVKMYGVDPRTISSIKHRKHWKQLLL